MILILLGPLPGADSVEGITLGSRCEVCEAIAYVIVTFENNFNHLGSTWRS